MNEIAQKGQAAEQASLPVMLPAVNLYEREREVVIVADMPGVSEKDVDLTVEKSTLTISGRANWAEPAGYELRYREFAPVEYRRVFSLTSDLDPENIKATMKSGVLTVTLAKTEKARPRKIAVTTT
jgi:HSP20 family protein